MARAILIWVVLLLAIVVPIAFCREQSVARVARACLYRIRIFWRCRPDPFADPTLACKWGSARALGTHLTPLPSVDRGSTCSCHSRACHRALDHQSARRGGCAIVSLTHTVFSLGRACHVDDLFRRGNDCIQAKIALAVSALAVGSLQLCHIGSALHRFARPADRGHDGARLKGDALCAGPDCILSGRFAHLEGMTEVAFRFDGRMTNAKNAPYIALG